MFTERWFRIFIAYLVQTLDIVLNISFIIVPLILGSFINLWWFTLYIITLPALGASIHCALKG